MVGFTPIETKYQNMICETVRTHGITSNFEDVKHMVHQLNDIRSQVVLMEVFEEIDYPISLEEDRLILLLPLLGTDDIKNLHFRFMDALRDRKDLSTIFMDNAIDRIDLIYLLQLWFTQIYNKHVRVFFGTDTQFIQLFNNALDDWQIYHQMRPVFPILFTTEDGLN